VQELALELEAKGYGWLENEVAVIFEAMNEEQSQDFQQLRWAVWLANQSSAPWLDALGVLKAASNGCRQIGPVDATEL